MESVACGAKAVESAACQDAVGAACLALRGAACLCLRGLFHCSAETADAGERVRMAALLRTVGLLFTLAVLTHAQTNPCGDAATLEGTSGTLSFPRSAPGGAPTAVVCDWKLRPVDALRVTLLLPPSLYNVSDPTASTLKVGTDTRAGSSARIHACPDDRVDVLSPSHRAIATGARRYLPPPGKTLPA